MNNDITTIIAADYMYLLCVSTDTIIDELVDKLNNNKPNDIYLKHNISDPCVNALDEKILKDIIYNDAITKINEKNDDVDSYKKYIILDEGVESAQCLTFADLDTFKKKVDSLSMVMNINNQGTYYKLSFPIIQIDDEENPEKLINKWMIDNNLKEYTSKLTTRLINIVGNEHDILIYVAFIK